jgi:DNA-binding SARP family transcriptional activator
LDDAVHPLRIYLAGHVALERGGVLVSERRMPSRQGRLAFALLVAERATALSKDQIADVLWNGSSPGGWEVALRAIVSKLRRTINDAGLGDAVAIEGAYGCYQLRLPADAWVDLEAAGSAIHDAENELRAGNLAAANGEALVAAAISRRPFLAGEDGRWVEQYRAKLRDIRLRALMCRARVALANGDAVSAATDAELAIELEPYHEPAYALLMRARASAGNDAEAMKTYDRLRELLANELGTSPSQASEAVYLSILRRDIHGD